MVATKSGPVDSVIALGSRHIMEDEIPRAEINMASIRVGGGIAGLIFTVGSMAVFLIGIPALRYMLPASLVLGCAFAVVFHFSGQRSGSVAGIFSGWPR